MCGTPDIHRWEKQRWDESEKRKSQRKQGPGVQKGRKLAKHCVFQMFCGPGGSKSRLAEAGGAICGCERCKMIARVLARSTFEVKMHKAFHARSIFGGWHVKKVHAFVAQSTCGSDKCKKLMFSNHFWELSCRKSACCCGA